MELILEILEYACYYPSSVLAHRRSPLVLADHQDVVGSMHYLTAHVPYLPYRDDDATPGEPGKRRVIKRLIFNITSGDHGPGSSAGKPRGTFKMSRTWLEVELWRRKYPGYKEDHKPTWWDHHNRMRELGDSPVVNYTEHYYHGYSRYRAMEEEEHKYKVGTWLLQRNVHVRMMNTDHDVVWDAATNELRDKDPRKWEEGVLDKNGKWTMGGRWQKNGRVANGLFIRELREGDEMRVMMRAYKNYQCIVGKCEIECWWDI
ncbi:hypothetical protein H072_1041 [Dactylellina haptotyla CBS 200.50]|uniref:Uncharacterized protein n=1 Tax=Dactylellina haptotyla (strain CBS 200.50) TaxID=1284197 RepID=S8AVI7_DACHA|nr:hypothetical protein H072_1041 [Dactylellina haptotyla CBS 200.50]